MVTFADHSGVENFFGHYTSGLASSPLGGRLFGAGTAPKEKIYPVLYIPINVAGGSSDESFAH